MGRLGGLCWVLLLGSLHQSAARIGTDQITEYRLVRDLLDGYSPAVCPRNSSDGPIEVSVSYFVMSLYYVDEKAQTIVVNGWLNLMWTDILLQWDPALYNNVDMVMIPANSIWLPDISIENGVDILFLDSTNVAAVVYSNGTVYFPPGGPMTLFCSFDLTNFPFDVQICRIQFTSWSTPERVMQYTLGTFTMSLVVDRGQWTILDLNQSYNSYPSDGESYSEVNLSMLIRRKPLYQVMNTVLPLIMLSFLNLAVFRLPPDSGEKVALSITVLLAYSIWILMMNNITPSAPDNIPLIGIFITTLMGISTLSVIVTVFVVWLDHKDASSEPVPHWLRKLLCIPLRFESGKIAYVKITWKMVASAANRTAFCVLFAITMALMLIAIGKIASITVSQPSSLKNEY